MVWGVDRVPGDAVLDVRGVQKIYGRKVHALRGVDLMIKRGEIFGLLGPNGAGKSTLVKILMTIIRPTRCQGQMLGRPIGDKATLRKVGYLPEHHRFPEYLSGGQVLDYFAALSDVPRRERKQRAGELLELVGMTRWKDMKVRQYSKGMRQRIGVAQALMMDPDLVVLDEPTDGVDPVGRRDIRNILVELRARGKAVLVNSHLLSELEAVSDRVAIMVQGRVTMQGTMDDLTDYGQRYEIEVEMPGQASDGSAAVIGARIAGVLQTAMGERLLSAPVMAGDHALAPAPGAGEAPTVGLSLVSAGGGSPIAMGVSGNVVFLKTRSVEAVQPVIDALRGAGVMIRNVRDTRPSLEDLFIRAVTDEVTGKVLSPGAGDAPTRTAGKGDQR
jgi:ABC-2 type transport system ATP-binding protein